MKRTVVVVGAGIAGLSVAVALRRRGADVIVLEQAAFAGGTVRTLSFHGTTVDAGPELIACARPKVASFCESLGLMPEMVALDDRFPTWLGTATQGAILPDAMSPTAPRAWYALLASPLLSLRGKVRAGLDLILPEGGSPSLGLLLEQRFGREAKERLFEPLFGGIYGTDIDNLEAAFVAPEFARTRGSLIKALATRPVPKQRRFLAPAAGMKRVVEALTRHLGHAELRLGVADIHITRTALGWTIATDGGCIEAESLVLATPPRSAARIASTVDPALSDRLRTLRTHSTASVVLGWKCGEVFPPGVSAVFVGARDGGALLNVTVASNRWPARTTDGSVVLRAIVGGGRAPYLVDRATDEEIVRAACLALFRLMPLRAPRWSQVVRFPHAQVAPEVGHMANVAAARARAKELGNIQLVGSSYDAGGIAGILSRAEATAEAALA